MTLDQIIRYKRLARGHAAGVCCKPVERLDGSVVLLLRYWCADAGVHHQTTLEADAPDQEQDALGTRLFAGRDDPELYAVLDAMRCGRPAVAQSALMECSEIY